MNALSHALVKLAGSVFSGSHLLHIACYPVLLLLTLQTFLPFLSFNFILVTHRDTLFHFPLRYLLS